MFDAHTWGAVPFHFWSLVFFVFGTIVGSFLNVCIHRMPLGHSIVSPPSHCPHCNYSIPWYLNIPLVTWIVLRGRCANCGAWIPFRYFLVELLTGVAFLGAWLMYGQQSALLVLVYCLFLAGLMVATFIDFEHFIIPDEITLGGIVVGFVLSALVPMMHGMTAPAAALQQSFFGIAAGGGVIYTILRVGKLLFGRQRFEFEPGTKITFTESSLQMPGQEIPYEDIFYRKTDAISLHAKQVEMGDRCYFDTDLRLSPEALQVGEDSYNPAEIEHLEVVTDQIVVPRAAMGFGDVKFMAGIGAFLGWPAVLFSLMVSAVIGSLVGVTLILFGKQAWSSRLPYGPYIALAAAFWIFGGRQLTEWWFGRF
jgi:leader peptidase (prepilin peptidase) / N-methyltransferase